MPRHARIHVPGTLVHMVSRFHNRQFYLDQAGARETYLRFLGQAAERLDTRIIAYCLMSSHVHLVLQLETDRLGAFAKAVHSPFGHWLNAQRQGLGAVLADRPKSVIVHSETHGLELIRYVHNNPVRAGLVTRACDSQWSSHRAYIGLEAAPPWLAVETVLGPEGESRESCRAQLAVYVDEGRIEPRRPELSGEITSELTRRVHRLMGATTVLSCPIVGPDDFIVEVLEAKTPTSPEHKRISPEVRAPQLVAAVFRALKLDPEVATRRSRPRPVSRARALVAWLWVERLSRPQVEVARALALQQSAVCKMLAKLRIEGVTIAEAAVLDDLLAQLNESPAP